MKNRLWIIGIAIALAVGLMSGGSQGAVNSSGDVVTIEASEKSTHGSRDSISAKVNISFATSITTDGTNLYVVNTYDHTIQKIVISTGETETFAGRANIPGSVDGIGTEALFNHPQGITTDGTNLFVAESISCTIRRIVISTRVVTTVAGMAGACGYFDGTGSIAQFDTPFGIATDGNNLYVADTFNGTIRKVIISSGIVSTIAGSAKSFGTTDGIGSAARFIFVSGIATDGTNLYVTDKGSKTIRQIVIATGEVTTLAGTAGLTGNADGTGRAVQFGTPYGIITDGSSLYVTDTFNGTIRKIVISSGAVTTLAGSIKGTGTSDGVGTEASFNFVAGIATDGTSIYVVDNGSNTIRKIVLATGEVISLAKQTGTRSRAENKGPASKE